MQIVFRVDASVLIGSGHVMRCLALARALRDAGAVCHFVSREHDGHLIDVVRAQGFAVRALCGGPLQPVAGEAGLPAHAGWLGATWQDDVAQTRAALDDLVADWLVVDHYALDARWERAMRASARQLLAIDDLADRSHDCDVLVDQNLGREAGDYAALAGPRCTVLAGPQYALLRPEFAQLRAASLARPRERLHDVLINMGGVDQPDATSAVLAALRASSLPADCRISVVMGLRAPWIEQVRASAATMPWPTQVLVNISDMGQRMAASDLAIGAAGSSSWERCCLGLPTLMVVLAANQQGGAAALSAAGAALLLGGVDDIPAALPPAIDAVARPGRLAQMSLAARGITDGGGIRRILHKLEAR